MTSDISKNYAQALYQVAEANKKVELVFSELRLIDQVFSMDSKIKEFFETPVISPDQKKHIIQLSLEKKVSNELFNTIILLSENNRLSYFSEIVMAYQELTDDANGVCRGRVRSAASLGAEQRKKIEDKVTQATGKKVILTFEEEPSLLGGTIAQVGGWTFDDSLESHLKRMSETLKRRSH